MSRTLTTTVDTALQAQHVPMLILIVLDFASGIVRLCNANYNFVYGGFTYLGAGRVASVKSIQEGVQQQMYGIEMSITGCDSALVSIALAEPYQGRACTVSFAPLDSNYQILSNPPIVFKGRMDKMNVELGETGTITLTAESRLTDWNKAFMRRYNNEDQLSRFPGDNFFEYVAQMVDKQIDWGVLSPVPPLPDYILHPRFIQNR